MKKRSFNKYNPSELISQLVGVLGKEPKREKGKMDDIIKEIKSISSDVFKELKKPKLQTANQSKIIDTVVAEEFEQ